MAVGIKVSNLTQQDVIDGDVNIHIVKDVDGTPTSFKTNVDNFIYNNSITTAKIADSNVTTAKIADANVTFAKLTDVIDDDTMATASATKLATSESIKAYVDNKGLGYNQTWKVSPSSGDILQTPNWGSYHTNNTGRPIYLILYANRAGQDNIGVRIEIDGFEIYVLSETNSGGGCEGHGSIIIPPGSTYRFQAVGDGLSDFDVWELS